MAATRNPGDVTRATTKNTVPMSHNKTAKLIVLRAKSRPKAGSSQTPPASGMPRSPAVAVEYSHEASEESVNPHPDRHR
jgi:hypothetical protein